MQSCHWISISCILTKNVKLIILKRVFVEDLIISNSELLFNLSRSFLQRKSILFLTLVFLKDSFRFYVKYLNKLHSKLSDIFTRENCWFKSRKFAFILINLLNLKSSFNNFCTSLKNIALFEERKIIK